MRFDAKQTTEVIASSMQEKKLPSISIPFSDLPSGGLAYPEGGEVAYFPYTFGDLKVISQSKNSATTKYEYLLKGIEATFDKKLLTFHDFLYINLVRKISSIGTGKIKFEVTCPKCQKEHTRIHSTDELDFEELPQKIEKLPAIIDIQGREVEFSPTSIGSIIELNSLGKLNEGTSLMEANQAILAQQITKIAGKEATFDEKCEIVQNASLDDYEIFREIDRLFKHGVKPILFTCDGVLAQERHMDGKKTVCENEILVSLDKLEAHIQPFREHQESITSRIRFGK